MPRPELLTPDQRAELLAFPADVGELLRLATFTRSDLAFIERHRGRANRLGIAVQLVYLRHLGKTLGPREAPHAAVLRLVARQLRVAPTSWDSYAARSATRREDLLELFERLKLTSFGRKYERAVLEQLLPQAMQTTQRLALAQAVVQELRRQHLVIPLISTVERLCAVVATRAQREIHRLLVEPLSAEQRRALDQLLVPREDSTLSTLAWLRRSPGAPSARALLAHIKRLETIRGLNLPAEIGQNVHPNRLTRLAREGAQTAVYQLQEYELEHRYATLVAILLDTTATITDEIFNLHDRLIGSFFTRVKHKYEGRFAADGKAVNEKVRLYAKIGAVLIDAKATGADPFKAIEKILPWDQFAQSVQEAEKLSRGEEFDSLSLLGEHFGQMRRYLPTLLETFEFRATAASRTLVAAVDVLRDMNRTGLRQIPDDAPTGFVRARWKPFVFTEAGVDRKYYEMAVVSELN